MSELTDKKDEAEERPSAVTAVDEGDGKEATVAAQGWKTILACAAVSAVVATATATALIASGVGKSKIATLDISGIVELEQMRMTALMMRKETSEEERMRAMSRMKSFGNTLQAAISEVHTSCKCVIVTRNAVIGQAEMDVTEEVKGKLGLQGIDLDQARASAEQAVDRRVPNAEELSRKAQALLNK